MNVQLLEGTVRSLNCGVVGYGGLFSDTFLHMAWSALQFLNVVFGIYQMPDHFDSFFVQISAFLVESVDFFQQNYSLEMLGGPFGLDFLLVSG